MTIVWINADHRGKISGLLFFVIEMRPLSSRRKADISESERRRFSSEPSDVALLRLVGVSVLRPDLEEGKWVRVRWRGRDDEEGEEKRSEGREETGVNPPIRTWMLGCRRQAALSFSHHHLHLCGLASDDPYD